MPTAVDHKARKDPKPYKCDLCTYKASQATMLRMHLYVHTGERPFICRGSNQPGVFDSCGMTFSDPSSCGRHEKHRHGKLDRNGTAPMTHKCPQCNAVLQRRDAFRSHLARKHELTADDDFIDECKVTKNTAPRKLRAQKYNPIFRVEPTSPLDRAVHAPGTLDSTDLIRFPAESEASTSIPSCTSSLSSATSSPMRSPSPAWRLDTQAAIAAASAAYQYPYPAAYGGFESPTPSLSSGSSSPLSAHLEQVEAGHAASYQTMDGFLAPYAATSLFSSMSHGVTGSSSCASLDSATGAHPAFQHEFYELTSAAAHLDLSAGINIQVQPPKEPTFEQVAAWFDAQYTSASPLSTL